MSIRKANLAIQFEPINVNRKHDGLTIQQISFYLDEPSEYTYNNMRGIQLEDYFAETLKENR